MPFLIFRVITHSIRSHSTVLLFINSSMFIGKAIRNCPIYKFIDHYVLEQSSTLEMGGNLRGFLNFQ